MAQDIPEFAKQRVCGLVNATLGWNRWGVTEVEDSATLRTFARYIAAHEEPPVDPLLAEARKIAANQFKGSSTEVNISIGNHDHESLVQGCLTALKRGIEIGKGQPHAD